MLAGRNLTAPSHLLYADDVLLFGQGTLKNINVIVSAFKHYSMVSGQFINWEKSFVYFGSAVSVARQKDIISVTNMRQGFLPFNYLGIPLFKGRPKLEFFKPIADSILAKLNSWHGRLLSMAGRVCLVKSVILPMFHHSFGVYIWPGKILKDLGKCIRNFIWSGSILVKKLVQVAWKDCCKSVKSGGLGIKDLQTLNKALFSKFVWRFINNQSMVGDFLRGRFLHKLRNGNRFFVSSSIWPSLRSSYDEIVGNCRWLVGLNSAVKFWTDTWLSSPIREMVDLNNFAWDPGDVVSDFIGLDGSWNLSSTFRISFPQISLLIDKVVVSVLPDKLIWTPSGSGSITCGDYYSFLRPDGENLQWASFIWSRFIPPSRSVLCWRLLLNRLPTDDKLSRTGLQFPSCCSNCSKHVENSLHLFLQCDYAKQLWSVVGSAFNVSLSLHGSIEDFVIQCMGLKFSSQIKCLWSSAVVSVFASIWRARNSARFKGLQISILGSKAFIWQAIREAGSFKIGNMHNSVSDLLILRKFGVAGLSSKAPRIIPVYWLAPAAGWLKVNTDGAAAGSPGPSGCGGIFRTARGFVRGSFLSPLGLASAFEAELWGVITAMHFARLYSWDHIWLECDSSSVVQLIQARSLSVPWKLLSAWTNCLRFIDSIHFKVSHIFREGNGVADILSKLAISADSLFWSWSIPTQCSHAHATDL